jgi:hypothetical protein
MFRFRMQRIDFSEALLAYHQRKHDVQTPLPDSFVE